MVVRAHAVLPPSARGRQPHRPAAVRRGRALRQAHRAVRFDEIDLNNPDPSTGLAKSPTLSGFHIFGTDQLGRDYLSRIIFGIRTSLWVALFVAILATVIGTAVGALAGFYGGAIDNLLMRFTDLILTLPGVAVLLTAAVFLGSGDSVASFTSADRAVHDPASR